MLFICNFLLFEYDQNGNDNISIIEVGKVHKIYDQLSKPLNSKDDISPYLIHLKDNAEKIHRQYYGDTPVQDVIKSVSEPTRIAPTPALSE